MKNKPLRLKDYLKRTVDTVAPISATFSSSRSYLRFLPLSTLNHIIDVVV